MNRAAVTVTEVLIAIGIIAILMALGIPAILAARDAARRIKCTNNLRQVAIGVCQYADTHGVLPRSLNNYSLHVYVLPHIEQESLYRQFDLAINALDYDGPLYSARVNVYECPSDGGRVVTSDGRNLARTNYHGNSGTGAQRYGFNGLFSRGTHPLGTIHFLSLGSVSDGLSNTAMLGEVAIGDGSSDHRRSVRKLRGSGPPEQFDEFVKSCREVGPDSRLMHGRGCPWSKVQVYSMLYNHVLPPNSPSCEAGIESMHSILTSTSMHSSVVNVAFADTSVHAIDDDIDLDIWRKLGSRAGVP